LWIIYNLLGEIIFQLPWSLRREIMDGMLTQYHYGNSGFNDLLTDFCFELCQNLEEWTYLAEKLLSFGGDWDKSLVMDIYKRLGDDDRFLALREANLCYGSDYFELAEYHSDHGDMGRAVSYARKGLASGNGNLDDLVSFLLQHYEKLADCENLEEIAQICKNRKEALDLVSGRLHAYYKKHNDYENAKLYLLMEFEHLQNRKLDAHYKKIERYLNDADWRSVESSLFQALRKRDLEGYMRICLEKGLKQEVYHAITENFHPWGADYAFFSEQLKRDFPEKIIEYYFRFAVYHVENGSTRKSYIDSMAYFKRAKSIYLNVLRDAPRWERKLAEIKERYKKRRAFLEEAKVLDS